MSPLIINMAPTGMIPSRAMTSHVPLTPEEIAQDAVSCAEAGASIIHVHARDEQGNPTHRKEVFREIILRIRERRPDLVISVTTSGRRYPELEKRAEVLELDGDAKPDMASLTLSSLNFNHETSVSSPDTILELLTRMNAVGIMPELEVFDAGMINYARYLIDKGLLHPPFYFNIILGNIACAQAGLLSMGYLQSQLPEGSICAFTGVGRYQKQVTSVAVASGNHVRIGLEDNVYYDDRRHVLATNLMLVQRVASIAGAMGVSIASPREARVTLGLQAS